VIELAAGAEFVEVENVYADGDAEVCGVTVRDGAVGKALERKTDCWVVG
jgi:hypothetical protein